ncbi:hypothetical protein [Kistimonas asteriae]|uniref:hypothetical protein n=1 Tax=Kistimonas asteriae TaxID=517724 RepID=UPI001BA8877D|nr:hypothetical protein [Kistimonas asteriae]
MTITANELRKLYDETKADAQKHALDEWIIYESQFKNHAEIRMKKAIAAINYMAKQTDHLTYDWTKDSAILRDLLVKWTDLAMTSAPTKPIEAIQMVLAKIFDCIKLANTKEDLTSDKLADSVDDIIKMGEDQLDKLLSAMKNKPNKWSPSFEEKILDYVSKDIRHMVYITRVHS